MDIDGLTATGALLVSWTLQTCAGQGQFEPISNSLRYRTETQTRPGLERLTLKPPAQSDETSVYSVEAPIDVLPLAKSKARCRWSSILGRVRCANPLRSGSAPF
jgi:hypothetical protein